MTTQRIHDLDLSSIHFHSPSFNLKGQKVVELSFDKDSTAWSNRMTLQLCYDETKPLVSNWALGQTREGQDPTKRDYELALNKEVEEKLKALDQLILHKASENSREWFKKDLKPEQVEARYKSIVKSAKSEGDPNYIKIKVKCPPADKPTPIKKLSEDGTSISNSNISILTRNAKVVAIVRIMNVWFMTDSFGVSLAAHKLIVTPLPQKNFQEHFLLSKQLMNVSSDIEEDDQYVEK